MNKNTFSKNMILYGRTIVDEMLVQNMEDGTVVLRSDIGILRGLAPEDSNTPLVEALSLRMKMRESKTKPNVSDTEILRTTKSRYAQDATEVQGYFNAIGEQMKDGIVDIDYQDAIDNEKKSVEQPKVE